MRAYAVLEGVEMDPVPFEVRRYRCRDEAHAGRVLAAARPVSGGNFTLWRLSSRDYAEWFVAFCAEVEDDERERRMLRLDLQLRALGAIPDEINERDADAFIRRRTRAMVEAIAAGGSSRPDGSYTTNAHFGTRRGAELDPRTGALTPRKQDG